MSDEGNETMETRVLAIVTAPDNELRARPCVQRWMSNLGRSGKSVPDHPSLTQVIGVAVATLETADGLVSLSGLNAQVGDEQNALDMVGDLFCRGAGQVVAYVSDTGGLELLWFRMLMRHALRRDWRPMNRWRWRNLADTFSIDGRFPSVPIGVAAASVGIERPDATTDAEFQAACADGDWHAVAAGLVGSLNSTAALYCALVGIGSEAFRPAMVHGL